MPKQKPPFTQTNYTPTRRALITGAACAAASLALPRGVLAAPTSTWTDLTSWRFEGRGWKDEPRKRPCDRLPTRAYKIVTRPVWLTNRNSAGLCAYFETDAAALQLRGELRRRAFGLWRMPMSGTSAVELYVRGDDGAWESVAAAVPRAEAAPLWSGGRREMRRFALYLPLYNGVERLELGTPEGATLRPSPPRATKPLVCYGTSITQGANVSRAGQCWTALVGRAFDREAINLGFSGHGMMDRGMRAMLAELDPCAYVIACLPNMWKMEPRKITQRALALVRALRERHPQTPIVLVEDSNFDNIAEGPRPGYIISSSRAAQRRAYDALVADDVPNLFYVSSEDAPLKGCSADGLHPNDLGMLRYAERLTPILTSALHPKAAE